jgi:hypothetical protein
MVTGNREKISKGDYEVISFNGEEMIWVHTEKYVTLEDSHEGTLMQYVDYPENLWNVLTAVTDENGYENYIIIAVPEHCITK